MKTAPSSSSSFSSSPSNRGRKPMQSLPYVVVNMAMTADGKIATANRAVSSFGSRTDHDHLLELRATADAVMAGARTVDSNAINMGPGGARFRKLRLRRRLSEYNLRVIVSGSGSINPQAEIFRQRAALLKGMLPAGVRALAASPIIVLTTKRMKANTREKLRHTADEIKTCSAREIDVQKALQWLRQKWRVKRLICEGGGELNDALFRAGLINELHLTICPKLIGGRDAPTIADGIGFRELADTFQMRLKSARRVGHEMFLVYERGES